MYQLRAAGDRRFYSPERDLVYAFPRYFRQALFRRFGGEDPRTGESSRPYVFDLQDISEGDFAEACASIKRVFSGCRDACLKPAELAQVLEEPGVKRVLEELAPWIVLILFESFRVWCADIAPKDSGDHVLDIAGLEEQLGHFAEQALQGGGA
jgi:hypothetical protein